MKNWFSTVHTSIGNRQQEQKDKIAESGGKEAHEKKLENDPVYKEEWEGHEKRIKKSKRLTILPENGSTNTRKNKLYCGRFIRPFLRLEFLRT